MLKPLRQATYEATQAESGGSLDQRLSDKQREKKLTLYNYTL